MKKGNGYWKFVLLFPYIAYYIIDQIYIFKLILTLWHALRLILYFNMKNQEFYSFICCLGILKNYIYVMFANWLILPVTYILQNITNVTTIIINKLRSYNVWRILFFHQTWTHSHVEIPEGFFNCNLDIFTYRITLHTSQAFSCNIITILLVKHCNKWSHGKMKGDLDGVKNKAALMPCMCHSSCLQTHTSEVNDASPCNSHGGLKRARASHWRCVSHVRHASVSHRPLPEPGNI